MQVHVKKPHIDVEIFGSGAEYLKKAIKKYFKDVEFVETEDDYVDVFTTDWYKEMKKEMTPDKALKVRREIAKLTLKQLSDLSGIADTHLSEMENGKRNIGIKTAKKLGKAFNCNYKLFI